MTILTCGCDPEAYREHEREHEDAVAFLCPQGRERLAKVCRAIHAVHVGMEPAVAVDLAWREFMAHLRQNGYQAGTEAK